MKAITDVVLIFYMNGKEKRYLIPSPVRWDGKRILLWSTDFQAAFQCNDEAHAAAMITKIFNPNKRIFQTEWVTVPKEKKPQFGFLFQKAAAAML